MLNNVAQNLSTSPNAHTLPCKDVTVKIVTKHGVISRYCQQKLLDWDKNNFLSALSTSFVYIVTRSIQSVHFNTRCVMVMTLLYCTCMHNGIMVCRHPSLNNREHCVYYIDDVSLTQETEKLPHNLFQANNWFYLRSRREYLLKALWNITVFCHNSVSCNITR